jgi:hypothetical protein
MHTRRPQARVSAGQLAPVCPICEMASSCATSARSAGRCDAVEPGVLLEREIGEANLLRVKGAVIAARGQGRAAVRVHNQLPRTHTEQPAGRSL